MDSGVSVHLISQHPDDRITAADATSITWLPFRGAAGYLANALVLRSALRRLKPDVLSAHYASGYGTMAALCGFQPSLLSIWGSDVYDFPLESPIKLRLLRWNLSRATALASTSEVMRRQAMHIAPNLKKPIWITPFGVDGDLFRPMANVRDESVITIGTVKALAPKYGVDVLVRAFAILVKELGNTNVASRLRLIIIGDGPQRSEIARLVDHHGLADRVTIVGAVPHSDVPTWLNRFDIFVAASRLDSESFGVAVVEASACALPVVVSDAGGLPEVVVNDRTGFIVPRNSPDDLAKRLMDLVSSRSLRQQLGDAGRQYVLERYSWNRCLYTMIECYRKLSISDAPK